MGTNPADPTQRALVIKKKKLQVRSFQTFAHIQKVIMFVNQTEGDLRESEWDEVKKL